MFNSKTVFVLGAGASQEVKLPTGRELTERIAIKLDFRRDNEERLVGAGDRGIRSTLLGISKFGSNEPQRLESVCMEICQAMPMTASIDDFIDRRQGNDLLRLIGKHAIVKCILDAEGQSDLFVDDSNIYNAVKFNDLENTWYEQFMRILMPGYSEANVDRIFENVSFVSFNYDRCLEHFLFYALQNQYGIDADESARIMSTVSVHHPYGSVGVLPWQDGSNKTRFGDDGVAGEKLSLLAEGIRTYTEQEKDEQILAPMRADIFEAELIVFLGFAFHPPNMELLKSSGDGPNKQVLGTASGLSEQNRDECHKRVKEVISAQSAHYDIDLRPKLTCYRLLEAFQYWLSSA